MMNTGLTEKDRLEITLEEVNAEMDRIGKERHELQATIERMESIVSGLSLYAIDLRKRIEDGE